jgi:hypothetical protein
MADVAYSEYVERKATGTDPSDVILNRSSAHAAVVTEAIFRHARERVRLLTNQLSADVYGDGNVVNAAQAFLTDHPTAKLEILAERPIDRATHPLLSALDAGGVGGRVTLGFIPPQLSRDYDFNFAVADDGTYRFEKTRDNREAIVQFRSPNLGPTLHGIFESLLADAVPAL